MNHESQTRTDLLEIFLDSGLEIETLTFEPGNFLYNHGSSARGILLITSGRVRTFLPLGDERLEIETIGPGQPMGLSAVISGKTSEMSVVAQTKVTAAFIRKEEILAALQRDPRLYVAINSYLSEALSSAYKHVRTIRSKPSSAGSKNPRLRGVAHPS